MSVAGLLVVSICTSYTEVNQWFRSTDIVCQSVYQSKWSVSMVSFCTSGLSVYQWSPSVPLVSQCTSGLSVYQWSPSVPLVSQCTSGLSVPVIVMYQWSLSVPVVSQCINGLSVPVIFMISLSGLSVCKWSQYTSGLCVVS